MKIDKRDVFAERSHGSDGGWIVSAILFNRRIVRRYIGYKKREAIALFITDVSTLER